MKAPTVSNIAGIPKQRICQYFKIDEKALDFEFFEKWIWWWRHWDKYKDWLFSTADFDQPPKELYAFCYLGWAKHLVLKMAISQAQENVHLRKWFEFELPSRIEANPNWRPAVRNEANVDTANTTLQLPPSLRSDEISKEEKMRLVEELMREKGMIAKPGGREKPGFYHLEVIDLYTHFSSTARTELKRKVFRAHDLDPDTEGGTTTKFIKKHY